MSASYIKQKHPQEEEDTWSQDTPKLLICWSEEQGLKRYSLTQIDFTAALF